jgi:hypothetical protein
MATRAVAAAYDEQDQEDDEDHERDRGEHLDPERRARSFTVGPVGRGLASHASAAYKTIRL